MARKTSKPDFAHSPFKTLKGLSVSPAEPPAKAHKPVVPVAGGPGATVGAEDEFSAEMELLGVRRMVVGEESPPQEKTPATPEPDPADDEAGLFEAALGQFDTVFQDEWPEDDAPVAASPRRLKQVGQGRIRIDAELDLHGLSRVEAMDKVGFLLDNAGHRGWRTLLIITGKGSHSEQGPVLREAVEACLGENRERVLEWGPAPRRFGGSGALVVFLRNARI